MVAYSAEGTKSAGNLNSGGWAGTLEVDRALQFAQLLAQPAKHARLRHAHGARAHFQLAADLVRSTALDRDQPERLPGAGLEFTANQREGAAEEIVMRLLEVGVVKVGRRVF